MPAWIDWLLGGPTVRAPSPRGETDRACVGDISLAHPARRDGGDAVVVPADQTHCRA